MQPATRQGIDFVLVDKPAVDRNGNVSRVPDMHRVINDIAKAAGMKQLPFANTAHAAFSMVTPCGSVYVAGTFRGRDTVKVVGNFFMLHPFLVHEHISPGELARLTADASHDVLYVEVASPSAMHTLEVLTGQLRDLTTNAQYLFRDLKTLAHVVGSWDKMHKAAVRIQAAWKARKVVRVLQAAEGPMTLFRFRLAWHDAYYAQLERIRHALAEARRVAKRAAEKAARRSAKKQRVAEQQQRIAADLDDVPLAVRIARMRSAHTV
jgi:signal transduction histidine kinase